MNIKMKVPILSVLAVIALILLTNSLTLTSIHLQPDIFNQRMGGFSRPIPITNQINLTGDLKVFNMFVRNNIPQVQGKELISYRQQVVSGMKYCCLYGKRTKDSVIDTLEVCLWSQPWRSGFLQLDSPQGRKISVNTEEITWPIPLKSNQPSTGN